MSRARTVPVTVNFPVRDLAEVLAAELGLQPVKVPKIARSASSNRFPSFHYESPTLEEALAQVIEATTRLDRDQYTSGATASADRLFEACKRLRRAAIETDEPSNTETQT